MTATKGLSRHYDQLQPLERLTAMLQAQGRSDEVEAERLRGACPRRTYSMPDADFVDREEVAEHTTLIVAAELQPILAQLDALSWVGDVCSDYVELHSAMAQTSYLLGWRSAVPNGELDETRLRGAREAGERGAALASELPDEISRGCAELVKRISALWKAFDLFAHARFELTALELFAAYDFAEIAQKVETTLTHYPTTAPTPEAAERYLRLMDKAWSTRFPAEPEVACPKI